MLGIDIGEHSIRVVNLRRRGAGFVLQPPLELPFGPEQASDPAVLGRIVSEGLERAGWKTHKAVMTLPPRRCFVRYFASEMLPRQGLTRKGRLSRTAVGELLQLARQSVLVPAEQLVFDIWTGADLWTERDELTWRADGSAAGVLVAAAQKQAVDFCREIATAANLKIHSLELRSLAAVNGLLLHWHQAEEAHIAVVYLERGMADVALLDTEGLVYLQSVSLVSHDEGWENLAAELVGQVRRIFHTVRLAQGQVEPQRIFLAAGDVRSQEALARIVRILRREQSCQITVCRSWEHMISARDGQETDFSGYLPAIGAAFDGVAASPTWFNFLHPRSLESEKKSHLTWRPFALIALAVLILVGAFWISRVQQKRQKLQDLAHQISETRPGLELTRKARENWNLFRPYMATRSDGTRRAYLNILAELSRLFPNTEEAHVTKLIVNDKVALASDFNITISGNVSDKLVLNQFMTKLNESAMFQQVQQSGELTYSERNKFYPWSFAVTCNFKPVRPAGPDNESK
ncbi:MAG: hypothetical protein JW810_00135 [Sedimentisphaerales bacterium]|nr:hypothetical protein [Sedimentisphaerales bacterium]